MSDTKPEAQTSLGLDENVAGLLAYLFTFISGLIFFFTEKKSETLRFNALQSIFLAIAYVAVYIVFVIIVTIIGFINPFLAIGIMWILGILLFLAFGALTIVLMVFAFQGKRLKLPIIGDIAEKNAPIKA